MAQARHENVEIEMAVLGGILMRPDAVGEIAGLTFEHFADSRCRLIAEVLLASLSLGTPLDVASLQAELTKTGTLQRAGGVLFLEQLASESATPASLRVYSGQVMELATRRRLRSDLLAVVGSIDAGEPMVSIASDALAAVGATTQAGAVQTCSVADAFAVLEKIQNGEIPGFLDCGFTALEKVAPRRGQLVIVGALSSTGKTALANEVASRIAARGDRVLFVSLEMSAEEVQFRRISAAAQVDGEDMAHKGRITDAGWVRLTKAAGELHPQNMKVISGSFDVATLLNVIRAEHARTPLVAVFVDYLGEILLEGKERHDLELGRAAMAYKNLGRELGFAAFLLAQLNRQSQAVAKDDVPRKPRNSDLRDSGQIEHCADVIWLLHREGRWVDGLGDEQTLEVACTKRRNARLATVELLYHLPSQRMKDKDIGSDPRDDWRGGSYADHAAGGD